MRTKTIKIYSFNELSDEAKQKAIEQFREDNHDQLYFFEENCTELLTEKHWNDIELQYSLACCQGDGLSFSGKLDLQKFLDTVYSVKLPKYKKWAITEYIYSVYSKGNTGRYAFSNKNQIEYDENYQDGVERKHIDNLWQHILEEIQAYYMETCSELEKMGYDEIEYQNSDDYIKEIIEANDYEFLEDGTSA